MEVHLFYLLVAVALLLPPVPFSPAFQKSLLSLRRSRFANALAAARVWQNWVDFCRAALGVYLLTQHAILTDPTQPGAELQGLAVKTGILSVVLLAQTVRFFRTVQLLAPIFYLCGLTMMLGGHLFPIETSKTGLWNDVTQAFQHAYLQGLFAVLVGWSFAIWGRNLSYQLPAMAVALAVAGYVLGFGPPLLLNCLLILVPLVLSTLFRRRLLIAASIPSMS